MYVLASRANTGGEVNLAHGCAREESSMSAQPPVDMVAPSAAHTTFYVIFFVQAAIAIAILAWRARAGRTWLPVAALTGGIVIGYFAPPIFNRLTYVWFPSNIP